MGDLEMQVDQVDDAFQSLAALPADPPSMRAVCPNCRRPSTVCWCPYLPREPIDIECAVVILQHPNEEKRCLRTAPMLLTALASGHCQIIHGRRFSPSRSLSLERMFSSPHTLLLYPGQGAIDMLEIPTVKQNGHPYTLVLLDGTWAQARSMYNNNPALHNLRQVKLCNTGLSEYVIRTQPRDSCLSTVESAAIALAVLENKPHLKEVLVRPLQALCQFQLKHGAVEHQSKECILQNGGGIRPHYEKTISHSSKESSDEHIEKQISRVLS